MFVSKARYEQDLLVARTFAEQQLNEKRDLRAALVKIVERETVAPNATVRRILSIAKAALGDGGSSG